MAETRFVNFFIFFVINCTRSTCCCGLQCFKIQVPYVYQTRRYGSVRLHKQIYSFARIERKMCRVIGKICFPPLNRQKEAEV